MRRTPSLVRVGSSTTFSSAASRYARRHYVDQWLASGLKRETNSHDDLWVEIATSATFRQKE